MTIFSKFHLPKMDKRGFRASIKKGEQPNIDCSPFFISLVRILKSNKTKGRVQS